jgi:hypothetical protein
MQRTREDGFSGSIYGPYLDPEVLALLLELRTSDFLELHLRALDRHFKPEQAPREEAGFVIC